MSPKSAASPLLTLADIPLAHPTQLDFNTARARLPVHLWPSGVQYHKPVCCSFQTGAGTWRIYCITAIVSSDPDKEQALIDAKVVLPPADTHPTTLASAWQEASAAQLSIQPFTGDIHNASSVQVSVHGVSHLSLVALKIKLLQTLIVPGSHIQLAPGVWAQLSHCQPAIKGPPGSTLYRITASTQFSFQGQPSTEQPQQADSVHTPAATKRTPERPSGSNHAQASSSSKHKPDKGRGGSASQPAQGKSKGAPSFTPEPSPTPTQPTAQRSKPKSKPAPELTERPKPSRFDLLSLEDDE